MSLGQPLTEDEREASTAMAWVICEAYGKVLGAWSLLLQKIDYGFIQSVERFLNLHTRVKSQLVILEYCCCSLIGIHVMLNNN